MGWILPFDATLLGIGLAGSMESPVILSLSADPSGFIAFAGFDGPLLSSTAKSCVLAPGFPVMTSLAAAGFGPPTAAVPLGLVLPAFPWTGEGGLAYAGEGGIALPFQPRCMPHE